MIKVLLVMETRAMQDLCRRALEAVGLEDKTHYQMFDDIMDAESALVEDDGQMVIVGEMPSAAVPPEVWLHEIRSKFPRLVCARFTRDEPPQPYDLVIFKNEKAGISLSHIVEKYLAGEIEKEAGEYARILPFQDPADLDPIAA